jgi:uncharacterized protein YndB with AHSA1/START domain
VTGTRTVETSVDVAVVPGRAIAAFLTHHDLAGWWKVSRSLTEPTLGAPWAVAWDAYGDAGTDHAWFGVVRKLADDRLLIDPLVMNEPDRPLFGPLALEISAQRTDAGSRVTVRHQGYRHGQHWDWLHEAVVIGWKEVLDDYQRWLEG